MRRASFARAAAILLSLAGASGCNLIFGLDDTTRDGDAAAGLDAPSADASVGPDADGDGGPPDARPDGGNGDGDGDGILDGDDDCPGVANPTQHDEDGDHVGDACDNCPHIVNPDQEDDRETQNGDTADGVGDACDPYPGVGGDRIVFFDGFGGGALSGSWTQVGDGSASVSADSLHLHGPNGDKITVVHDLIPHGHVTVDAPATIVSIDPGPGTNRSLGPLFRFAGSGNDVDFYWCELTGATNNDQPAKLVLRRLVGGTGVILTQVDLADPIGPGTRDHRARAVPRAARTSWDLSCNLGLGADGATEPYADGLLASGRVGFRADGLEVDLPYIIAYDRDD
jgi:hypothetical protein